MIKLVVMLEIQPQQLDRFIAAIDANAQASRTEPGCIDFEVIQDYQDPTRFTLYETYVDEHAVTMHRKTPHYAAWKAVEPQCVLRRSVVTGSVRARQPANTSGGDSCLRVCGADVAPFDRGAGVITFPYVGSWNCTTNDVTTGRTVFQPGTGIPLHTHNVEEAVLVLRGQATAVLGDNTVRLSAGDGTWVPRDVPHRFANRGTTSLEIYWVYGGREVTRTICATGETFAHLSDSDRGAVRE
jgi:HTH-type transcriptional regulator, repressor for puuD